jgi:alpha-1,3/alpha-1,6-mannosyltransferase
VDAAVGLQQRGYQVTIYTGYHNKDHAFPETIDGTLRVIILDILFKVLENI